MKVIEASVYLIPAGKLHPVIVSLTTDEGITGIGEAGLAYGVGGSAAAAMVNELVERFVIGQDSSRIESLWSEMYDHSFWTKGGGAITFAALSAIEMALWDIKGKRHNAPVYELLGGRVRDRLRVYANGWYGDARTPAGLARAAERPLADGYTALKCYPLATPHNGGLRHVSGRMVDREFADNAIAMMVELRKAVGDSIDLMVDFSGGLTTDEMIRFSRRLEDLNLLFVEEPADPFDVEAMKLVAESIRIPVAAGERIYSRRGFRTLFEKRAAHIIQPDVGNTGGISEAKKIASMAEAYNMRVAPHNCGSALSTAAALQLSYCITNFMILEIYPYFPEIQGYVQVLENSPELKIKDGFVELDAAPGLGVSLDQKAVAPHLAATCTASS